MIEEEYKELSLRRQCELLSISRASYYYEYIDFDESEIANRIREIYLWSDCRYGYRKITKALVSQGITINHKRVSRMMRDMGIEGLYPKRKPNTSANNKEHQVYPYLLKNLIITRPSQVFATDITYIRLKDRFVYLIAIIDIYSRYIISYEISHSMEVEFCTLALEKALLISIPEIFNTDQGSQFTSKPFIDLLISKNIQISMDHKGRCFDNIFIERLWRTIKQELIYHKRLDSVRDLERALEEYVPWYNNERLHQGINYKRPADLYFARREERQETHQEAIRLAS